MKKLRKRKNIVRIKKNNLEYTRNTGIHKVPVNATIAQGNCSEEIQMLKSLAGLSLEQMLDRLNGYLSNHKPCIHTRSTTRDNHYCPEEQSCGDMNADGGINVLDVVALVQIVLNSGYNPCGDLNSDGAHNVLDIVTLVTLGIAGIEMSCPRGCMDPEACNYDDPEFCNYPEENFDCEGNCALAVDCLGVCGGTTAIDWCGVCGGGGTSCEITCFGSYLGLTETGFPGPGDVQTGCNCYNVTGGVDMAPSAWIFLGCESCGGNIDVYTEFSNYCIGTGCGSEASDLWCGCICRQPE